LTDRVTSPGWELRAQALQTDPIQLWMTRSPYAPVFGFALDELGGSGGWWTLVTFSEGSTSLYTSGSGSVIGAGTHATVRAAGAALLTLVGGQLSQFSPSPDVALPSDGDVVLRALTTAGQRIVTASARDLSRGQHDAAGIYRAAHALVVAVRQVAPGPR